jgi:predicted RNase H-like HicB family nuclease
MASYTVVLTKEEDGRYSVSVPALSGCHTWGDTYDEAIEMAKDAIALYLEELRSVNAEIPTDDTVIVTKVAAG